MSQAQLAFKAFDCHELLCHAVATEAGLYEANGLSVELVDSTFIPDEALPENSFSAACGAALAGFLRGGAQRVVFVSCDRPMFWLYGRFGLERITDLEGARIATFPDAAPPAGFLRKLLADAGVRSRLLPCRDDISRLGLLRAGSVDAALLSSLFLPGQVTGNSLQQLAFIGDKLRLPSTGLAVSAEQVEAAPDRVAAMVGVYRRSMQLIFSDGALLRSVLAGTFAIPEPGLPSAVETVRACYNPGGCSEPDRLQAAVDGVAATMGLESRPASELYDFSLAKNGS